MSALIGTDLQYVPMTQTDIRSWVYYTRLRGMYSNDIEMAVNYPKRRRSRSRQRVLDDIRGVASLDSNDDEHSSVDSMGSGLGHGRRDLLGRSLPRPWQ